MKPPLRTKSVGTKVSEAEFALLEERARGAGLRLAEWVREALLSAPVELGPDSGEVALGESWPFGRCFSISTSGRRRVSRWPSRRCAA
jgi:hypothetical protein